MSENLLNSDLVDILNDIEIMQQNGIMKIVKNHVKFTSIPETNIVNCAVLGIYHSLK